MTHPDNPYAWCMDRFADIEAAIGSRDEARDEQLRVIERKLDSLTGSLIGDPLHPNGVIADVRKLKAEMQRLQREWESFLNRARGFAIGIAIGAGLAGGGVATFILKLVEAST